MSIFQRAGSLVALVALGIVNIVATMGIVRYASHVTPGDLPDLAFAFALEVPLVVTVVSSLEFAIIKNLTLGLKAPRNSVAVITGIIMLPVCYLVAAPYLGFAMPPWLGSIFILIFVTLVADVLTRKVSKPVESILVTPLGFFCAFVIMPALMVVPIVVVHRMFQPNWPTVVPKLY